MDKLRMDFIVEVADEMTSHSASLAEAAYRGNAAAVRQHFECIRAIAKHIATTLAEIEASEKQDKAA